MRTAIKILLTIFSSTVGLVLLFLFTIDCLGTRADIVDGVTGNKIKQIELGMTLEQVVAIIGRPYRINSLKGLHDGNCKRDKPLLDMDIDSKTNIKTEVEKIYNDTNYCCEGNKMDLEDKFVTLTYTRHLTLSKHHPMLWIHLDSTYKVTNVYAKQYDGLLGMDDPCIYSDGIIDKGKFNNCFE